LKLLLGSVYAPHQVALASLQLLQSLPRGRDDVALRLLLVAPPDYVGEVLLHPLLELAELLVLQLPVGDGVVQNLHEVRLQLFHARRLLREGGQRLRLLRLRLPELRDLRGPGPKVRNLAVGGLEGLGVLLELPVRAPEPGLELGRALAEAGKAEEVLLQPLAVGLRRSLTALLVLSLRAFACWQVFCISACFSFNSLQTLPCLSSLFSRVPFILCSRSGKPCSRVSMRPLPFASDA